jgi:hypothetical protein
MKGRDYNRESETLFKAGGWVSELAFESNYRYVEIDQSALLQMN